MERALFYRLNYGPGAMVPDRSDWNRLVAAILGFGSQVGNRNFGHRGLLAPARCKRDRGKFVMAI